MFVNLLRNLKATAHIYQPDTTDTSTETTSDLKNFKVPTHNISFGTFDNESYYDAYKRLTNFSL